MSRSIRRMVLSFWSIYKLIYGNVSIIRCPEMNINRHRRKKGVGFRWCAGLRALGRWRRQGATIERIPPKKKTWISKKHTWIPTVSRHQLAPVRRLSWFLYKGIGVWATKAPRHSGPSRAVPTTATARPLTHPEPPNHDGHLEPYKIPTPPLINETLPYICIYTYIYI